MVFTRLPVVADAVATGGPVRKLIARWLGAASLAMLCAGFSNNAWCAVDPAVVDDLTTDGVLRVAINYGNPVLAQKGVNGAPQGVSVSLAKALGRELGVPVTFSTYDAAGKVFTALETNAWDVAFIAIDPVRAEQILFSEPYVLIEGTYLVARDARFQVVGDLDQPGIRVAVGQGSAYDLYLTRALKYAQLVRVATSAAAIDAYREQHLDAAAGVRQPLEKAAAKDLGVRVLSDSFTSIRQAMAVPQGHQVGAAYIHDFVERMKASGFVRSALIESGQTDVSAPPGS